LSSVAVTESGAGSSRSAGLPAVSSTIVADGCAAEIARAAAMPSRPGMRTSMSVMSGASQSASRTAASPDEASPMRSNPGVARTTLAAASRNQRLSSTTSTVTDLSDACPSFHGM
jgi:hypothetical protein